MHQSVYSGPGRLLGQTGLWVERRIRLQPNMQLNLATSSWNMEDNIPNQHSVFTEEGVAVQSGSGVR